MTHHIKLFLYLAIFLSINLNCKKTNKIDTTKFSVPENNIEKSIISKNKDYQIWHFSDKNNSNKYKNIEIFISKDSIKIFNTDTKKITCKGEIIQTKKDISDYTLGEKSAENLKSELDKLFNTKIQNTINIIENADSEISKKGCLFPFYEMFFIDDELFIYDKEYFIFTKTSNLSKHTSLTDKKYNINKLPFDFDKYYKSCYVDQKIYDDDYPSYKLPEDKKILEDYGIKENPTIFFMLPKINNFQPFVLGYTDSDVEGYYLTISKKGKIISSLQIAQFDGESVNDFIITKDFKIELYSRKNTDEKRVLKKVYKIQEDGIIKS